MTRYVKFHIHDIGNKVQMMKILREVELMSIEQVGRFLHYDSQFSLPARFDIKDGRHEEYGYYHYHEPHIIELLEAAGAQYTVEAVNIKSEWDIEEERRLEQYDINLTALITSLGVENNAANKKLITEFVDCNAPVAVA